MMSGCAESTKKVVRFGSVTGIKQEKIAYYKELHAKPWPAVMEALDKCHIQNYSIYLAEVEPGKYYLFGYYEYVGKDYDADMKKLAADPMVQKWWKETDPCQQPVPMKKDKGIWLNMEEVFYHTAK